MARGRLVREPGLVQGAHQEIAGAVAGEDPTGAIRPVRGGCEADHEQARRRIAEARHRAPPVHLFAVCRLLLNRDAFAIPAQARAALAGNDRLLNPEKLLGHDHQSSDHQQRMLQQPPERLQEPGSHGAIGHAMVD